MSADSIIGKCNSPDGESSSSTYTSGAAKLRQRFARGKKPRIQKYDGPPVYMAVDAEWETLERELGVDRERIHLLTMQFELECAGRRVSELFVVDSANRSARMRFASAIRLVLKKARKAGVITEWPDRLTVFGHFLRADVTTFFDFWVRKDEFDSIGKTFTARSLSVALGEEELPELHDRKRTQHKEALILPGDDGMPELIRVRFVDTLLLTPGRANLDTVGQFLGVPKVELPSGYTKDRMRKFFREQPEAFRTYAMRDVDIALTYGIRMAEFARENGLSDLPATLAGFGPALLRRQAAGDGVDLNSALGLRIETRTLFYEHTRRYRTVKQLASITSRQLFEEFAAAAYLGGRNECFFCGPSSEGVYYDYDLPAAYTTAMCAIRPLDYEGIRTSKDLGEFEAGILGLAHVRFRFPDGTRFPCLPARTDHGLMFPLEGESVCASPELVLARRLGAEIEIVNGLIIPWASDDRLFEPFTRMIQQKRRDAQAVYGKGSLEDKLFKEIGNSLYGKTAQGVHPKRVFNSRKGLTEELRPSAITNPYFAAYVTSFIRAVVGEQIAGVPANRTVISVTTDGFLTDAPLKEIDTSGPLCAAFLKLRQRLFDEDVILEEKHRVRKVVAMRTRGQLTAQGIEGFQIVLAKAGVKPPAEAEDQNEYMLDLYLERQPGQRHAYKSLISSREMWIAERDMTSILRESRLNLEFDMKRCPERPVEREVRGRQHLAFSTKPWRSVQEALEVRARFDGWRKGALGTGRVLKTLKDYDDWAAYCGQIARIGPPGRGIGLRRDGTRGVLKRLFLRAFVRGEWGISNEGWTYKELASFFEHKGIKMSETDVKNAKRDNAPLVEIKLICNDEAVSFLRVALENFSDFELFRVFDADELQKVRREILL
ncbi:DNA polymerase [Methylorubrum extorquens]|uniref:DNA polymerase n=1 Tax=Methylorubrum extorquens TaxID=408 RepID=UPI0022386C4A|nr:DNA polymerase [Methylorubrum extorquens]UYW26440.1 DNA polymerase [Methylorubrum extorquens]